MPDSYDWRMAKRIAFLAAQEPGRGIHRNDLGRRLGNLGDGLGRWIMLAYARGMVDCVRDFVVAPPVKHQAPPLCWRHSVSSESG